MRVSMLFDGRVTKVVRVRANIIVRIYNIMHGVYNACIRICIYFTYNVDDYRHIYILYTRTKLYTTRCMRLLA